MCFFKSNLKEITFSSNNLGLDNSQPWAFQIFWQTRSIKALRKVSLGPQVSLWNMDLGHVWGSSFSSAPNYGLATTKDAEPKCKNLKAPRDIFYAHLDA